MLLLRCGCTGIKKSDLRRFKCLHNGKKKLKQIITIIIQKCYLIWH